MSQLDFRHPVTASEFTELHALLPSALRDDERIPIASEYPRALDQAHSERSFCAFEGGSLVSHINLLPRTVHHTNTHCRVGLIGNVATSTPFRGQGFRQKLMKVVE